MKKDAHFYAILAFCRACGFNKTSAFRIAYASQFVDDAKINLIFLRNQDFCETLDTIEGCPAFFDIATCHSYFKISTFNYESMVNNTVAFHFVPGCSGKRFTKKMRCKEESPIIMHILEDVFREDDLYRLGIALHAYADTFSHQGFSGLLSKVNAINNCQVETKLSLQWLERFSLFLKNIGEEKLEKYLGTFIPGYGHAQAMDLPDLPYLTWSYEYDHSDDFKGNYARVVVNNPERYQRAFEKIRAVLQHYLELYPHHRDESVNFDSFSTLYEALLLFSHDKGRITHWQNTLVKTGLFAPEDREYYTYTDDLWLKEAFINYDYHKFHNRRVENAITVENFKESSWYRFIQGVKWYKRKFFYYSKELGLYFPS